MAAGFGETVKVRATTSILKVADLAGVPPSVMVTLWEPVVVVIGITNLNGVNASVLPSPSSVFAVFEMLVLVPTCTVQVELSSVKSTRVEVTVEPGVTDVAVGVAPAFWTQTVVAA